jgi:hypothetical protein
MRKKKEIVCCSTPEAEEYSSGYEEAGHPLQALSVLVLHEDVFLVTPVSPELFFTVSLVVFFAAFAASFV